MDFSIQKAISIIYNKVKGWLEELVSMLPNMLIAVIVMVFFYFVARYTRRLAVRLLQRFIQKAALASLFATIIYLSIIVVGLIIALNILHLQQTVTSLLAGAGIIGLALGFAFQDITANFISGVMLAFRQPIKVGDIIKTDSYMGTVEKIDLRVTIIRTFQGLHVIIPNKDVLQSPVINYTKTNERRIDLEVGISYSDDLEKVKKVAESSIESLPYLLPGKEVKLFYNGFGDSSINFTLMFWVHYPDEPGFWQARSDAIMRVKSAFDQNGITIPFPIRTLDFNGNVSLSSHPKD